MNKLSKDILDFWDENSFNPSLRHQGRASISLEKVIKETIEKEVFSKFPELVAGDVKVEVIDNIQYDTAEIYVGWRVWTPASYNYCGNVITLENMRLTIKIPLSAEIMEDQPEAFSLHFKQALASMEEQMNKVKLEFYVLGISPKEILSYLKRYGVIGKFVKVPVLNRSANISGIGAIP